MKRGKERERDMERERVCVCEREEKAHIGEGVKFVRPREDRASKVR